MNRRGFLGALLGTAAAAVLSPLEKLYAQVAVKTEPVATFSDINAALKEVFPPGYFAEIVEQQSMFWRKGSPDRAGHNHGL